MKKIFAIAVCLLALWTTLAVADRRGQIMVQRPRSAASALAPPTTDQPGIWLDVLQQVTNGFADFTITTNCTNYGFLGGYFSVETVSAFRTNNIFRTIGGGALTSIAGAPSPYSGFRWFTNGVDANNQCYFQSNYGTLAVRFNLKTSDIGGQFIQTGTLTPPGYCLLQLVSGTWYSDWGQPGVANRISKAAPVGSTNTWLNVVYVKSNDLMQIWIAGTNWTQTAGHSTESLYPTNNYAGGPLELMKNCDPNGTGATNYLYKRILMWRTAVPPSEMSALNTWMTAMP